MKITQGDLPLISYVKAGKVISLEKGLIRSVEAKVGKMKMKEFCEAFYKLITVV